MIQRAQKADKVPRKMAQQRSLVEIQEEEERARQVKQDVLRCRAAEEHHRAEEAAVVAALLALAQAGAGAGQGERRPRKTGKKSKPSGGEQSPQPPP